MGRPTPAAEPIPFLDLSAGWQELEPAVTEAYRRVLGAGHYVLGPEVEAFESEFARFLGVGHCVGVGSGFDALQLPLRAWEIGAGDEVIVPAFTPVATWMAVSITGASPVGVDVDSSTLLIDPALAEAAITGRTRAIVPVHLYGRGAPIEALRDLADRHDLRLLEDAAQAHGARRRGGALGALGDAGAFSFYPTKNLGAMGDAGAVVTDDEELAAKLRMLRSYGWQTKDRPAMRGANSRLDPLQAAFLRVKLSRLEDWNRTRRELAEGYLEELSSLAGLELPPAQEGVEPSWHLFVVAHDERDRLRERLAESGVGTLIHYPLPPHRTAAYRDVGTSLPVAERAARRVLSLPLYPQLSPASQERVVSALRSAL